MTSPSLVCHVNRWPIKVPQDIIIVIPLIKVTRLMVGRVNRQTVNSCSDFEDITGEMWYCSESRLFGVTCVYHTYCKCHIWCHFWKTKGRATLCVIVQESTDVFCVLSVFAFRRYLRLGGSPEFACCRHRRLTVGCHGDRDEIQNTRFFKHN